MYKNSPPVAGAVAWANSLYQRQKRPILRFKTMPSLFNSTEGEALRNEYLAFAKVRGPPPLPVPCALPFLTSPRPLAQSVDKYIKSLYGSWCEHVKATTSELLRQPVLGPGLLSAPLRPRDALPEGAGRATPGIAVATAAAAVAAAMYPDLVPQDRDALHLPVPPYNVNFSPELATMVRECRLLDRMGYAIPEVAMNVALQVRAPRARLARTLQFTLASPTHPPSLPQADKLHDYVSRLQAMLDRYHSTLAQLTPVEANLMQVHLAQLRADVRPGFTPLNWNSLHVNQYISDVLKALQHFDSVLGQVRKSCSMLEDAVACIADTVLISVEEFDARAACLEVVEVYDIIERQRAERLSALVTKYRGIKPIMQQVEGAVCGTDTCAAPALAEFYRYWERRFFNAISKMVLSSIVTFQALLNLATVPPGFGLQYKRTPLCRIKATFSAPDVVLSPDQPVFTKYLRRIVSQLIKRCGGEEGGRGWRSSVTSCFPCSATVFTRWMDGTCLECDVDVPQGATPPDLSFLEDIMQNPEVINLTVGLNPAGARRPRVDSSALPAATCAPPRAAVIKVLTSVKRFTTNWSRYGVSYGLWAPRKPEAERKLIERAPSAIYFDARLGAYARLAEGVDALSVVKDIGFVRVDCYPVAVACRTQALKLKHEFGSALREIAHKHLVEVSGKVRPPRSATALSARRPTRSPPTCGADQRDERVPRRPADRPDDAQGRPRERPVRP